MYQSIYVPLDNSDHSNRAMRTSMLLGKSFGSKLVGCHVYSAKMHDYRFRQMEFTLPEEYLDEEEIARQRKIHDSLITMGLELISDCYLTEMEKQCTTEDLPFEKRMMDGKHTTEILKDLHEAKTHYDLVVLGALGIGRTRDAQLGSVATSVARAASQDVWVVKHLPQKDETERDTILVGVDGSPESFGALMTAMDLAKRFGKKVEVISVYDPYLHYSVFKGIVNMLTDEAAKVFRFEEQNQLHEEIIDTGLAEIYQSHLNVAEQIAKDKNVEVTKTLLDGKVFQKVLDHARKTEPWLLVVGRIGIHKEEGQGILGSNTNNLLRLVPCDILLTTALHTPELDIKAEESIQWTAEAEARMSRAPELVRGLARTTILRLALQKGHSVVTTDLVDEAMDRYMPKNAKQRTEKLAQALAFSRASSGTVSICKQCNTAAMVDNPVTCTTCGANDFEQISKETVDRIAQQEGGTEEDVTYDGRKIRWTKESRTALKTLTDPYQRRRAKARIEKAARRKKMETITLEHAQRFVEEEAGVVYKAVAPEAHQGAEIETTGAAQPEEGMKILAHDRNGVALLSHYDWTEPAIARVLRVPKGFMRDGTQERIEGLAAQKGLSEVDLELVREGIDLGLEMMKEMIGSYTGISQAETAEPKEACPVAHEERPQADDERIHLAKKAEEHPLPARQDDGPALNEVSIMTELAQQRRDLEPN